MDLLEQRDCRLASGREYLWGIRVSVVQILSDFSRIGDGLARGRIMDGGQRVLNSAIWFNVGRVTVNGFHRSSDIGVFDPDCLVLQPFEIQNNPLRSFNIGAGCMVHGDRCCGLTLLLRYWETIYCRSATKGYHKV